MGAALNSNSKNRGVFWAYFSHKPAVTANPEYEDNPRKSRREVDDEHEKGTRLVDCFRKCSVPPCLQHCCIALFAVLLGVADGLSLGSLLIPHDEEHPNMKTRHVGMSIGLLTSFAMNVVLSFRSQMYCNVGGMLLPAVPVLAEYFKYIGSDHPETVIVLIPIITIVFGVTVYIAGRLQIGSLVEQCPFPVYAGFIAGSGCQLLEFAMSMMFPNFVSFLDYGSWLSLACPEGLKHTGLGVFCGILCFIVPHKVHYVTSQHMVIITIGLQLCYVYGNLYMSDMCCSDFSMARANGWLFAAHRPDSLHFYQLWMEEWFWSFPKGTVKWDLLLSTQTVSAYIQVSILGFLTVVKNIFGIAKLSGGQIDIDKEIEATGLANIASGLMGASPGGAIMSYSYTAHQNGASKDATYFRHWLVVWSLLLFVFGDYVVALVPTMIPASILFWLGLELCVPFTIGLYPACNFQEWFIIMLMVLVDMLKGCTHMLGIGLLLTLVLTIRHNMETNTIKKIFTMDMALSDVKRPLDETMLLKSKGKKTYVIKIDHGYMAFWAGSQIRERVLKLLNEYEKDHRPHESRKSGRLNVKDAPFERVDSNNTGCVSLKTEATEAAGGSAHKKALEYLVLDLSKVTDISIGVLATLLEIVELGRDNEFVVIFVVPPDDNKEREKRLASVFETLHRFEKFTNLEGKKFLHVDWELERLSQREQSIVACRSRNDTGCYSLLSHCEQQERLTTGVKIEAACDIHEQIPGLFTCPCAAYIQPDILTALEHIEDSILHNHAGIAVPIESSLEVENELTEEQFQLPVKKESQALIGLADDSLEDFEKEHIRRYSLLQAKSMEMEDLSDETDAVLYDIELTVEHCESLEDVKKSCSDLRPFLEIKTYEKEEAIYEQKDVFGVGSQDAIPPLIWLVSGKIDHFFLSGDKRIRVECAKLESKQAKFQCVGPMDTIRSFSAAISHLGSFIAAVPSTVVLLSRNKYVEMLRKKPLSVDVLNVYLQTATMLQASKHAKAGNFYNTQINAMRQLHVVKVRKKRESKGRASECSFNARQNSLTESQGDYFSEH